MKKLLIANRGEIAVRVIRAARERGIRSVAVFSDADANALHVRMADEAVHIGTSEAAKSYLDAAKIISAAESTGADAIHPGYGFLSERASFAEACERSGIVFIGPPASAMRLLGSKSAAKTLARENGVSIVPGMFESDATAAQLKRAAEAIGYPVMLKASAGGGGRGMRIVRDPSAFDDELRTASDEALKSFGDGSMMVEKLVDRPRHVEVQILADNYGNVASLFERECSLQRRHQKVLEESPAHVWNDVLTWDAMRDAAERLVRASGYRNAGTVEFMVDTRTNDFYFLEVNTRLQVEHPVTEAITGVDLVQWQLRIADGEKLSGMPTDRIQIDGHAIEARIIAEDPSRNFLPSVGKILAWMQPHGVRVETGFEAGDEVSRFYDSLLAKIIAHGPTREEATQRLHDALTDFHVLGIKTNVGFLLDVIRHPEFKSGEFDTGFLGREFIDWVPPAPPPELGSIVRMIEAEQSEEAPGAWGLSDRFRNTRA
jgi:acetyl/propionyl-CoA carboxylase alpha subunit